MNLIAKFVTVCLQLLWKSVINDPEADLGPCKCNMQLIWNIASYADNSTAIKYSANIYHEVHKVQLTRIKQSISSIESITWSYILIPISTGKRPAFNINK